MGQRAAREGPVLVIPHTLAHFRVGRRLAAGAALAAAIALVTPVGGRSVMSQRRVISAGAPADALFSPAVAAGGLIFASTIAARPAAGAPDDIAGQTRDVLERLSAVLVAAGSSLGQAVTVNVYVKRASDFDAMNAVYRTYFVDRPPTRTTVVAPPTDGALVAMSAIAVPDGAPRETLHPAGWMKSPRPYSYIVRAGGLVFFSGLVSRRGSDDQVVAGSAALQVRTILDNAATLLDTADVTFDDVVAARVFLTDASLYDAMNEEYGKVFTVDPPARATAIVDLMGNDAWIEITLIASTSPKSIVSPAVSPSLPLSAAVRSGPFTFLSGVIGQTTATTGIPAAQTKDALTRIGRTLEAAGLSTADVADCTVFAADIGDVPQIARVYRETFQTDRPSGGIVNARLANRAGQVELLMLAVR